MSQEFKGKKPQSRPQSAGPQGRRPQSAQGRAPRPNSGAIDRQALDQHCQDMKQQGNILSMQNTHLKTRLMGVDKELTKRERLLKQLVLVNKNNQGVGMDLVLKMREERNLLPIFKQRVKDLQRELQERDAMIRDKKRNHHFTRILELEIELASWQHEVQRLDNLTQDPTAENPLAQAEVDIHQRRCEQLQHEIEKLEKNLKGLAGEVADLETSHDTALEEYREKENQLTLKQEETRKLAFDFKEILDQRKKADALEAEMEEIAEEKAKYEIEIASLAPAMASGPVDDRCRVSSHARKSKKGTHMSSLPNYQLWSRLRKAGASHPDGLLRILQNKDSDGDGFLSMHEFSSALASLGIPVAPRELEGALSGIFPGKTKTLFWLDLLVFLELLGSDVAPVPAQAFERQKQAMPDIRELRVACMQQNLSPAEFQSLVANVNSRQQAEEFFGGQLLLHADWVNAWEELGTSGLLLQIPVSDVAMSESQRTSWWARCCSAVRKNQVELSDGFLIWNESGTMTEDQFTSICLDILGQELSISDVAFLAAFAWDGSCVSGQRVLSLAA